MKIVIMFVLILSYQVFNQYAQTPDTLWNKIFCGSLGVVSGNLFSKLPMGDIL